MPIQQWTPKVREISQKELMDNLCNSSGADPFPFSPKILAFCSEFSRMLFRLPKSKQSPEITALAYRLRKSELSRLKDQFEEMKSDHLHLSPRGLVFHIPPSNVDTIFVYSWLYAILSGNRNIIRLSQRHGITVKIITEVLNELFAFRDFESLKSSTIIVSYGHETEITGQLSKLCNVRVIWGGDATVSKIRSVPMNPSGKDITFPDRFSFAVLTSHKFLNLKRSHQKALAARFYSDAYWFNQMACSCPRLLVWIGSRKDSMVASAVFLDMLHCEIRRRKNKADVGTTLTKITFAYQSALNMTCSRWNFVDNALCALRLENLNGFRREHCGGGFFFEYFARSLNELSDFVHEKDQTIAYFGLSKDDLNELALALCGKGVDRIVPIGQSLNFDRFWDGYDLLREFTRLTFLEFPDGKSSGSMNVGLRGNWEEKDGDCPIH
jgi:hypothetical protein